MLKSPKIGREMNPALSRPLPVNQNRTILAHPKAQIQIFQEVPMPSRSTVPNALIVSGPQRTVAAQVNLASRWLQTGRPQEAEAAL